MREAGLAPEDMRIVFLRLFLASSLRAVGKVVRGLVGYRKYQRTQAISWF
jgi:hypothetical protein